MYDVDGGPMKYVYKGSRRDRRKAARQAAKLRPASPPQPQSQPQSQAVLPPPPPLVGGLKAAFERTPLPGVEYIPPIHGVKRFPNESVFKTHQKYQRRTFYSQSKVCNGKGLFVSARTTKGRVLAVCGGVLHPTEVPTNHYQMAIQVNGREKVLDGTPCSLADKLLTQWAFSNEYTWDADRNNATVDIIDGAYCLVATKDIPEGGEIFWSYGGLYDWSHVILEQNVPLVISTLRWVNEHLHQGKYVAQLHALESATRLWSEQTIRSPTPLMSECHRFVI